MAKKDFRHVHGVLLLDKQAGRSSNHALQDVRFLFAARKAGHTGTLDPFATGMLVVCFGEANKYARYMLDADKTYQFVIALGSQTETGDPEGDVIATKPIPSLSTEKLRQCEDAFSGKLSQRPPKYSALKVNGRRAYELARQGQVFELASRDITVSSLSLKQHDEKHLIGQATVSKGTYIRTLVEDIAKHLGTVGYCQTLRRLNVAGVSADNKMHSLEYLRMQGEDKALDKFLLPIDFLCRNLPQLEIDESLSQALHFGQRKRIDCENGTYRAYHQEFMGVVKVKDGVVRPLRLINTELI